MPSLPPIPPDVRLPLGLAAITVALLWVGVLYARHLVKNRRRRTAGHPTLSTGQHLRLWWHHHLLAGVLLVGGVLVLAGVGAAVVLHYHGGARFQPNRHIPPHVVPRGGGQGKTPNLGLYLPSPYQQFATNSCWCQGTAAAFYAAEHQRGSLMPVPSPWRCFWYGAHGQDSTGTLDQAVAAFNEHGMEPLTYWPVQGPPDATDDSHTTLYHGLRVRYLYYGAGYGHSVVEVIRSELDAGHVVVMLWDVHQGALANGVWVQRNLGGHVFYHFSTIYAYLRNPDGSLSFAVRNSWSGAWGINGDALFPEAVIQRDALAAGVIEAGAPIPPNAWLSPAPTATAVPTATPRPTQTPLPPATPTRTATSRPTSTPLACVPRQVVLLRNSNARVRPALSAAVAFGVARGLTVLAPCPGGPGGTPHWIGVISGKKQGWVLRSVVR